MLFFSVKYLFYNSSIIKYSSRKLKLYCLSLLPWEEALPMKGKIVLQQNKCCMKNSEPVVQTGI